MSASRPLNIKQTIIEDEWNMCRLQYTFISSVRMSDDDVYLSNFGLVDLFVAFLLDSKAQPISSEFIDCFYCCTTLHRLSGMNTTNNTLHKYFLHVSKLFSGEIEYKYILFRTFWMQECNYGCKKYLIFIPMSLIWAVIQMCR